MKQIKNFEFEKELIMDQLQVQSILYMRRSGAYGAENYKLMEALKEWASDNGLLYLWNCTG